jgi:TolB-like protein/thioredoxin-like negative regulator of GroEL
MLFALAHYNVLERIGAGGMGEVYRARDTKLGRTVAIKMLPERIAGDPDRRDRFLREARATAALSHPGVAMLFEVGEDAGRVYLVFEYVAGQTLRATLAGRPLGVRLAIDLATQIADGLAEAHAAGIIHRDIKPDNVMVTTKEKAKILDFGLAEWTEGGAARSGLPTVLETAPGLMLGTLAYMSPEQALGQPIDARTDIFSLGAVLYEMLTGRNPFMAPVPTAVALNVVQKIPPPPSAENPDVPREADPIVMRALAKDLNERYQTAATLAAELRSLGALLDIRAGDAEPRAFAPSRGRRVMPWRLVAALVVAAVAGGAGWTWRGEAKKVWRRYVAAPPAPRIAVLPLDERSAGGRTYFADGLTEDLITRLGQMPGLQVLGRSVTRELRGKSVADAAARLTAEAVLTGVVEREGDELRVSLELVDPGDGVVIWSDRYTKPVGSVFAVQAEIADDVARALRLRLASGAAHGRATSRTVDARAYDVYAQARDAAARRELARAIELFNRALSIDETLAEAHAGLAEALYLRGSFEGAGLDADVRGLINAHAESALSIDPDLPAAQVAAALGAERLADALGHLRRAVELDASYGEAYHQIGDQIVGFDPAAATRYYERSLEVDPGLIANYLDLVSAHLQLGQQAEARRTLTVLESTRAAPGLAVAMAALLDLYEGRAAAAVARFEKVAPPALSPAPAVTYARMLVAAGRPRDALLVLRRAHDAYPQDCDVSAVLAGLLIDHGNRAEAERLLAGAARGDVPPACEAILGAASGDGARAARALGRLAVDERSLREWTRIQSGAISHVALRRRWYPWGKVAGRPAIEDAERALEAARIRLRNVARERLEGLL